MVKGKLPPHTNALSELPSVPTNHPPRCVASVKALQGELTIGGDTITTSHDFHEITLSGSQFQELFFRFGDSIHSHTMFCFFAASLRYSWNDERRGASDRPRASDSKTIVDPHRILQTQKIFDTRMFFRILTKRTGNGEESPGSRFSLNLCPVVVCGQTSIPPVSRGCRSHPRLPSMLFCCCCCCCSCSWCRFFSVNNAR